MYADTAVSVPLAFAAYGGVLIVYYLLARRAGAWPNRLVWFGILAGAGYVLTIAGFTTGSKDTASVRSSWLMSASKRRRCSSFSCRCLVMLLKAA
ncbi:MAG: hypothetical protein HY870_08765 [Chloroflexi bacterium]|nr:hypothetical protein [Chloroflexota bacterium]